MKDYLFRKNLSVKQMAGDLDISTSYLYQLIRGERKPSIELAQKIEELTDGEVSLDVLLGIEGETTLATREKVFSDSQTFELEKRLSFLEKANMKIEDRLESIEARLKVLEEGGPE